MREWRRKNPEKARAYDKGKHRKRTLRRYGLTSESVASALESQGGTCAICRRPLNIDSPDMAFDHDHDSGKFRGLLCLLCNRGLGVFWDSVEMLERAVQYLEVSRIINGDAT